MRTIGVTLALVVTLGLVGAGWASASQSGLTDTESPSAVPADAAVVCSAADVPAGCYPKHWFIKPNACLKCQDSGKSYERTGRQMSNPVWPRSSVGKTATNAWRRS